MPADSTDRESSDVERGGHICMHGHWNASDYHPCASCQRNTIAALTKDNEAMRDILRRIVDDEDCHRDHHGY